MDSEQKRINESGFQKLDELSSSANQASAELLLECLTHPYQFIRIEAIRRVCDFGR
jgi:hypothetical protein